MTVLRNKELNKTEFDAWLDAYPRKLERDVFGAYEPPLVTWNDFERAPKWPDSVVAHTAAGSGKYFVLEDINAPVVTDSKPDLSPLFDMNGTEVKVGDKITIQWGGSFDGVKWTPHRREHIVEKRDVGTPYETYSPSGCANILRGMPFLKYPATFSDDMHDFF